MYRFIYFVLIFFGIQSYAMSANFSEMDIYYKEMIVLFSDGKYRKAIEKCEAIEKEAPDYPMIKNVLIMDAFLNYLAKKYVNTVAICDAYLSLYKKDENTLYMLFLKASALDKRKKSPSREHEVSLQNIDGWLVILNSYPSSIQAHYAMDRINELNEMRFLHELYTGNLYHSRGDYYAAIRRFNNALSIGSVRYEDDALKQITDSYRKIGLSSYANKYWAKVKNKNTSPIKRSVNPLEI